MYSAKGLISIITPAKNIIQEGRVEFFNQMMEMLSKQTYKNFEHIVIDGGSKDGTMELLQEYKEKKEIDILISEDDKNLHVAVNKGLKLAKGEFIYIMNTDDYFTKNNFFQSAIDILNNHQEFDYTHGNRIIVSRKDKSESIKHGDERVAFWRMPFRWQTMLIRREIYEEFGPFDEKYKIASDYKFFLKVILAEKKGYYFNESLVYSLDGGITVDRELCIKEVSEVLFDCYGLKYNISLDECKQIYLRKITPDLFLKIKNNIKNERIISSLSLCYSLEYFFGIKQTEGVGEYVKGKVRDNFVLSKESGIRVMVATDRQSINAKYVCSIPFKGQIINQISSYWFLKTEHLINNHFISLPHPNIMTVRQMRFVIPLEIVVRRHIAKSSTTTSIYHQYFVNGRRNIYGLDFPNGLRANEELPMGSIITPTTKDNNGDDKELSQEEARSIAKKICGRDIWDEICLAAISIFEYAREELNKKGLLLVDTKFEFGIDENGGLCLIDELLTTECSRIWTISDYEKSFFDNTNPNYKKDILSDYLKNRDSNIFFKNEIVDEGVIGEMSLYHYLLGKKIVGDLNTKYFSEEDIIDFLHQYVELVKNLDPSVL